MRSENQFRHRPRTYRNKWHSLKENIDSNPTVQNEKEKWRGWTNFENEDRSKCTENIIKKKYKRLLMIIYIVAILALSIVFAIIMSIILSMKSTATAKYSLRWNSIAITVAGITGQNGNASNLLFSPCGLSFDSYGTLYIADGFNNRVQKYSKDGSSGITVTGRVYGLASTTLNSLNFSSDVTIDSHGTVYVTDTFNHRVQFLTNDSLARTTIAEVSTTTNTINTFDVVYGITHDPDSDTLYISDTGNHRIVSYRSGFQSGNIFAGGNGAGVAITQLSSPMGLYFDRLTNSLLIANYGANNIVRWKIGAHYWTLVAGNIHGLSGNTSDQLSQPTDVALDPMGNIYVADMGNHRIQFFSHDQSDGITIAGTSHMGNSSITLNGPRSVTLDNQLNLYVADTWNHRIQKFLRF